MQCRGIGQGPPDGNAVEPGEGEGDRRRFPPAHAVVDGCRGYIWTDERCAVIPVFCLTEWDAKSGSMGRFATLVTSGLRDGPDEETGGRPRRRRRGQ